MTDGELLRDYSQNGSQAAFAELVRRHTDWIFCGAVRLVREQSLAEEVVQAVFIVLAGKAGDLPASVPLNQWLFQVMRYSAKHALRDEARRKRRERQAADWAANEKSREAESAEDWNRIVGRLDAATARLGANDRQAVLLRFYERKSMAEVGLALGVSEDAAKKRVARAIGRLRGLLSAREGAMPALELGTVLLAHTTGATPPALAESAAAAATNGARIAAGCGHAIAQGAIQMMIITKIRHVAAVALMAVVPLGLVGAVIATAILQTAPAPSAAQTAVAQATNQADDAPYVQAIRLVRELGRGPDERRINADAALNAATNAFLDSQAAMFDLIHAGAAAHSTEWGVNSGDSVNLQSATDQLGGVRSLASLEVLRARRRWNEQDSLHGQEDLLDALALGRNVAHDHPVLVIALVQARIEQMVLAHWAQLLPTTPADQLAALPERLKELPAAPRMAEIICAEQSYAVNSPNTPAGVAAGLAPFYDSVSGSLDRNPTQTPEEFQKTLDDGIGKIGFFSMTSRSMAKIVAPSLARAYVSISATRATEEMFGTGIAVIHDGAGAADKSTDPFGQGPFNYAHTSRGFELHGKLQRDGKAVQLDFGL